MENSSARSPGSGTYARSEHERRFLLRSVPAEAHDPRLIEDHYVSGTTFRVRRVTEDERAVFKFTQKVRPTPSDPRTVRITNLYVTESEYERLVTALPGVRLTKTRWSWRSGDTTFAVDEFCGDLSGLVVAEVEVPEADGVVSVPPLAVADVSFDDRFSGGSLAAATGDEVRAWVSEVDRS